MPEELTDTMDFDGRRILIVGDVKSGKTRLTEAVLAAWGAQDRSRQIVVLDLAPEKYRGVGGRLHLPENFPGIYLRPPIVPPRLQAPSEEAAEALAAANAAAIDPLLGEARSCACSILVVNDATLFLQAGDYDRFLAVVGAFETVLLNAYYGNSFPDYRLSRRERRLTERLMTVCDRVIHLPMETKNGS